MKEALKKTLFFVAIFAATFSFTACDDETGEVKEDLNDIVQANNTALPSTVSNGQTLTLSEDFNFSLPAALRVEDGGVLIIKPGVTITATPGSGTSKFIVVEQGGKIMAEGTAQKAIVMTSETEEPGAWGGLLIMGKAPINVGTTAIAEIGDAYYGGTDAADNSGVIKYVRVEYTGARINDTKEHNGITFYGVGNSTVVDYVEAFRGADDGIEFFGGTVNVSHLVSVANQDDLFDYAEGWSGTAQYLYLVQTDDADYPQDKGIEGDNLGSNNAAAPFSNPNISNVTLISYATNKNEENEATDALRIREGSKGTFSNIVIKGWGDNGIDVRSLQTLQNVVDNTLQFSNIYVVPGSEGKAQATGKMDDGEVDPGTVVNDAKAKLATAVVTTEPSGADFDSWKGPWVKMLP